LTSIIENLPEELTNSQLEQAVHGFVRVADAALLAPYVDRYFADVEALWAERSFALAEPIALGAYPRPVASEALAIAAAGYSGPLAVTVTGPWTLAADLYLARGDRVLSDPGAVREVVQALAVAVGDHVAQVRRQVPGADVVVQLDEPLLAQVGAGVLPTFSGYSRLRAVPGPDLVDGRGDSVEAQDRA
jgi:hypothetical protein